MKSAVLMTLLIALPAVAAPHRPLKNVTATSVVAEDVSDPTLFPRLLQEILVQRQTARATTVTDSRSARSFMFPAAGNAAGANGLYFRSDVSLANYAATDESVLVAWWPSGTSNPISSTAPNTKIITLPASQIVRYPDFVGSIMNAQGIGTLLFIPIKGTSSDPNAAIDGFSRIYTQQPGSSGTVSQPFEALDVMAMSTLLEVVSLGLQHDSSYRTNFGIVNADPVPHTYNVQCVGERAQNNVTVTVPAYGMVQQAVPDADYGALSIVFTIKDPGTANLAWLAYASSTDNTTGDGWVSVASSDFSPSDLANLGF